MVLCSSVRAVSSVQPIVCAWLLMIGGGDGALGVAVLLNWWRGFCGPCSALGWHLRTGCDWPLDGSL